MFPKKDLSLIQQIEKFFFFFPGNVGHEIASPNVHLVRGGISFVSGDGNLRLI